MIKTASRVPGTGRALTPSPPSLVLPFILDLATRVVYVCLYHCFFLFESDYMVSPLSIPLAPLKTIASCGVETVCITHSQRAHGVNDFIQRQKEELRGSGIFFPFGSSVQSFSQFRVEMNNDVISHEKHTLHTYAISNNRKRPRVCTHASMDVEQLAPPLPLNKQGRKSAPIMFFFLL